MSVCLTGSPCSGGIVRVLCTLTLERDSDSCHPALPPGTSFPVWSSSAPSFLSCSQLPPFSGCRLLSPPRAQLCGACNCLSQTPPVNLWPTSQLHPVPCPCLAQLSQGLPALMWSLAVVAGRPLRMSPSPALPLAAALF